MGTEVMALFNECLRKGRLRKIQDAERLITKELATAKEDLSVAKEGLKSNRWKWSTIQAYYAMFHAARALLYSHGYSEHSHYCLRIAVEALFVQKGLLDIRFIDALQAGKTMRENADYEAEFSEMGARKLVKVAGEFFRAAQDCLKKNR